MTTVDKAVAVMQLAKEEIFALRRALLGVKERGPDSDPCWCCHAPDPLRIWLHDPYCETARNLIMNSPLIDSPVEEVALC